MNEVMERYLTDAQQLRLLSTVKGRSHRLARRDHAWIGLLKVTGLRIGEFSKMSLGDAQFALETGWIFIPKKHRKGGTRDHKVPVTKPVREALEALVDIRAEFGGTSDHAEPLIFSRKHQRMSVRAYQDRMAHWCSEAGIESASPHWLRHTRAKNLMKHSGSADPRGVVQQLLGHASIASTGIYTAPSKEDVLAAAEAVDGRGRVPARRVAKAFAERGCA